jgi:pimeloyl-ACP methyl ester carboxylesterase
MSAKISAHYPYRSPKAKEEYLEFLDRLAKDWPIAPESRLVPTSFGQTFVRIGGPSDGPPLVLLPGLNTTSLVWAPNIEAWSNVCRTYALDTLGDLGRSVCIKRIRDVAGLVSWLDEVFCGLELADGLHLLGLSHGGWLAAQYALRVPERLGKLVLLAPGGLPIRMEFYLRAIPLLTGSRYFARSFVYWLMEDLARKDPARAEASFDRLMMTMRCLQPHRTVSHTVLSERDWQNLQMPVLFLVGEHEKIYSACKAVQHLHAVEPRIRAEIIPDGGHDLTVSQPEMVNRKVLEFLVGRS